MLSYNYIHTIPIRRDEWDLAAPQLWHSSIAWSAFGSDSVAAPWRVGWPQRTRNKAVVTVRTSVLYRVHRLYRLYHLYHILYHCIIHTLVAFSCIVVSVASVVSVALPHMRRRKTLLPRFPPCGCSIHSNKAMGIQCGIQDSGPHLGAVWRAMSINCGSVVT